MVLAGPARRREGRKVGALTLSLRFQNYRRLRYISYHVELVWNSLCAAKKRLPVQINGLLSRNHKAFLYGYGIASYSNLKFDSHARNPASFTQKHSLLLLAVNADLHGLPVAIYTSLPFSPCCAACENYVDVLVYTNRSLPLGSKRCTGVSL